MYEVTLNLNIPLKIQKVHADTTYEAVNNCQELISATLPLLISDNIKKIREEMFFEIKDVQKISR